MKKILSLLSLLVMTVSAMATDYTGELNYNLMMSFNHNVPEGKNVIITKTGDNLYDVTLKDCDFSSILGASFGDLTFSGLPGTTVNGKTTIDVKKPANSFSASAFSKCTDGDLLVKFNGSKAFVYFEGQINFGTDSNYTFKAMFGTDDVPEEPTSIATSKVATDAKPQVYSIGGTYVGNSTKNLSKGIYIVNGKKVVIK